jgi:hypothetical protein
VGLIDGHGHAAQVSRGIGGGSFWLVAVEHKLGG